MKKRFNIFDPQKCETRWICYLDILGFRKRVTRHGSGCESLVDAVHTYYQSREIVEDCIRRKPLLRLACWSDSFVICADDDSSASFWHIEQASRLIMNEHLMRCIPIRGALACGAMYVVGEDSIYIGGALIEAYEHAENQNWIGFLLCRSATRRLARLKLSPSRRLNYQRWTIPWNNRKRGQRPLYAYIIGASSSTRGKNDYLGILHEMMFDAETRREKNKYRDAIEFLERYGVLQITQPAKV